MSFLKKYRYDISAIITIIALIIVFIFLRENFGVLSDREAFRNYINSFGFFAPIAIILIIILEVVIAPIPGFIPITVAGFLFGPIEGSIYAYIGNVTGSIIAFLIARKFGKYLVAKIVTEKRIEKYEKMISRHQYLIFSMYFLPIFPVDILSFAFGLSGIKIKKFVLLVAIGFVSNVILLNIFGDFLAGLYF
jgi:uncharacterized membrane protein YdjX (TVP38/TMEM64 family)